CMSDRELGVILAVIGGAVGLLGAGALATWPEKKWIGSLFLVSGIAGVVLGSGWSLYATRVRHVDSAATVAARIRLLNVVQFSERDNPARFPGITIFFDNAGTVGARAVVSHFAVGFANG